MQQLAHVGDAEELFYFTDIEWSSDSSSLGVTGEDTVRIWNTATFSEEQRQDLTGIWTQSLLYLADKGWIVLGQGRHEYLPDRSYLVYAEQAETLSFQNGMANLSLLSPDRKTIAVGARNSPIILWNVETGAQLASFNYDETECGVGSMYSCYSTPLFFSPDGTWLVASWGNVTLVFNMWNVETGQSIWSFKIDRYSSNLSSEVISSDGIWLATLGMKLQVWNVGDGNLLNELETDTEYRATCRNNVIFSPDDQYLIAGQNGSLQWWNTASWDKITALNVCLGQYHVHDLAVSPDSRMLAAVGNDDNQIQIWDLSTGVLLHTLTSPDDVPLIGVSFSPDGTLLASVDKDSTVRFWGIPD